MAIAGLDILDFFRGVHSWYRLFRFLRQLPRTSRFQAALHNDEDRAADQLREERYHQQSRASHPPLETWTQESELLALIADLLACQRADFAAVHSKSHRWRKPELVSRPVTALERVRHRSERARHHDIVRSLIGDERNGGEDGREV